MVYLVLFIAELVFLFLFSRTLTNSLARLIYKISQSKQFTYNFLAVIFLPGTIIHEIAHMLSAGMLFVPSGDMEIFPQIDGDEVRFGSVKIAETDPIRRFIIGLAPVILGSALILAILFIALQFFNPNTPWWQIVLIIFLVFEIANTMFSSKKDMEGALVLLGAILIFASLIVGLLYLTNSLVIVWGWISQIQIPYLPQFFQKSAGLLLIPLGINLAIIGLAKILRA